MQLKSTIEPAHLGKNIERFLELAGKKILSLEKSWDPSRRTPVYTEQGIYTTRGWTEWTQGFQYGCAILQFDATGANEFLEIGRRNTVKRMAPHVSHTGVHDHGFNNLSTYGNLRRLMNEGRIPENEWERNYYELALKLSGAVQASRWSANSGGLGFIYSFNGPHSLFVDTIRSVRILNVAHQLGHVLRGEGDRPISLLHRGVQHALSTARFNIFHGKGRDAYDTRGRTAHECIFNCNDGQYRCPNSQQGYSPFSTWTRGLAWAILGFAEELEFIDTITSSEFEPCRGKTAIQDEYLEAARATSDFYIANTPADGVPYWDTGAPGLVHLGDYLNRPSDPFNDREPVDSSAAAIAAQGLIRLGNYLKRKGQNQEGERFYQSGLTAADSLFQEPYLSTDKNHQGLILHSIYHRPNGWDAIPKGSTIPHGESSMWGDYHALELAVLLAREVQGGPYPTFFS
jgi:unsaturated chondroitin disaccharide hydrolase